MPLRDAVDVALVDDGAVGTEEVEGDRRAAPVPVGRSVDGRGRRAVRVAERAERPEQVRSERLDARVHRLDPDPFEVAQPDLHRRQVEEVDGAVLEVRRSRSILVVVALHERGDDRAAGEPRPLELVQRLAARQQRSDPCRPAEQLVERDRHEVRMPARQVEPVGRREGGRVDEHVPAVVVRVVDPVERVVDAREVRLRREGEQVVVRAAQFGEVAVEQGVVDAELRSGARHVGRLGAAGARELAYAVH